MIKTNQVQKILSNLEDDVSDLNEDAAIFVSKAGVEILAIVVTLEAKIEFLKEVCNMDDVLFANKVAEALQKK